MTYARPSARLALLAAAASVPLVLGSVANAQYRVDTGHANDANPRVGSGGYNGGGRAYNPGAYSNDIVYGNVSGGKQFRGNISSFNPYNFQAPTSGFATDRFIRESSGTTTGGVTSYNADITRPYYSPSQTIAPPPGYVRQPYAGGYVPNRAVAPVASDQRIDAGTNFRLDQASAPAGTYNLPGPADPTGPDSTIDPNATGPGYLPGQAADGGRIDLRNQSRFDILSPYTTLYRQDPSLNTDELRPNNLPLDQSPLDRGTPNQSPKPGDQSNQPDGTIGRSADAPSDTRLGQAIQKGSQLDPLRSGTDLNIRNVRGPQAVTPQSQSPQYAALQARLQRFRTGDQPEDESTIRPGITNRPVGGAEGQARNGTQKPTGLPNQQGLTNRPTPGGLVRPENPTAGTNIPAAPPAQPPATPSDQPAPPPVKVASLGTGVGQPILKAQLDKAEGEMKAGKFTSAVDTYDAAEQDAPNNPLVLLGRANAELGSSYYRRAEGHLRDAYAQDPALLMGQYDLRSMIGEKRLSTLVTELRDLAKNDPDQPGPVFLLAYIDYNTGNERRAGAYLDLAQKRSPKDPFYAAVKKFWSIPADKSGGDASTDINK